MALTAAQVAQYGATIKQNITASPDLVGKQDTEIAALYNAAASPAFSVWRTNVSREEIQQNGFAWIEVDNLTVGKARIWEWLFIDTGACNPAKANVRAGIAECWSGNAARNAVQAVVLGHCKRGATRFEKVFATGTGSVANPATMGFEGSISAQNVSDILSAF